MNHDYDSDSTNGKNNSGIFKLPYNVMLDSVMEGENVFAGRMSVVWQGMWRYDQVGLAATAEKIRTSRLPVASPLSPTKPFCVNRKKKTTS